MSSMNTLKAIVRDGHIMLNEPTELDEGTVINLYPVIEDGDGCLDNEQEPIRLEDKMPPEELERFRAELYESHEQACNDELIPAEEILNEL